MKHSPREKRNSEFGTLGTTEAKSKFSGSVNELLYRAFGIAANSRQNNWFDAQPPPGVLSDGNARLVLPQSRRVSRNMVRRMRMLCSDIEYSSPGFE
jgi:hypothetical protein